MQDIPILCVSNRRLVEGDFLAHLQKIFLARPYALILREKDLDKNAYGELAHDVQKLALLYKVPLFLNANIDFSLDVAKELGCGVHTSFENYKKIIEMTDFNCPLGVSIHSIEEAVLIASRQTERNVSHVIAGHIFPTDCKKDLAARGLEFLQNVCKVASFPVFGIGGMTPKRMQEVYKTGARGAAVMSSLMQSPEPAKLLEQFSQAL